MAFNNSGRSVVSPPDSPTASMHGAHGPGRDGAVSPIASAQHSSTDLVQEKQRGVVLNKRQKFKRHCGRFKWWYVIGVIILLAILLPIFFMVIIPRIVQDLVNDQDLPIYSGSIQAISPTQMVISLNTSLNTPLPAHIDAMDMYLYNKNTTDYTPFAKLRLPGQDVHHKTYVIVENQTVTVDNEEELVAWFDDIFDLPTAGLSVRADATVHLGELTYHPKLDLTLEVPALNALTGFDIDTMNFLMEPNERGRNIEGTLNLPNAGILTLGLGNVTFNLISGTTQLGIITVYDAELPPGNNTRNFDGMVYFNELIPNLSAILDDQQDALGLGYLQINATGNATVVNGQHIGFIEKVFRKKTLTVNLPILTVAGNLVRSVLDADGDVLMNAFGDTFGNQTLFDNIMDHWETYQGPSGDTLVGGGAAKKVRKRAPATTSLMMNMLRLGLRSSK